MRLRRLPGKCGRIRFVGLAASLACGGEADERAAANPTRVAAPADSLVASSRSGTEVWFTLAREGTGADGSRCIERGIEIRRGATRLRVPLLYTGSAPVVLNDSTLRARLWTHCAPGDLYLVDLRTGHPVRE
jgi:hypothetical protein